MPKRIDKLTPEQAARFEEWSKQWIEIGLSTAPADFDKATDAALPLPSDDGEVRS